jgi:hypothetical protein
MVKIISPSFSENPLAKTISNLGNTMFGDTLTPAYKREMMRKQQMENFGIEELAQLAEGGFTDPRMAASRGILGGLSPEHVGMFQSLLHGQEGGARDPRVTGALGGLGKYPQTAEAFDLGEQNKFDMNAADNAQSGANNAATIAGDYRKFIEKPEPAMVGGQPAFAPQGQLTQPGTQPILNENQVAPIDEFKRWLTAAESAMPEATPEQKRQWAIQQIQKNKGGMTVYGPDGQPILTTGDVGGMTNKVLGQAQELDHSFKNFNSLADQLESVAQTDPTLFGAAGTMRGMAQGATQLAGNVSQIFGGQDINQTLETLRQTAIAKGVEPTVVARMLTFDPNIPQLETLSNLMLYTAAEAIANQEGRAVSDKDIDRLAKITGDPTAFFGSQQSYMAKLAILRQVVDAYEANNNQRLGIQRKPRQYDQPAAPATGGDTEMIWTPEGGLQGGP